MRQLIKRLMQKMQKQDKNYKCVVPLSIKITCAL